jgi:hypothetical protein
MGDRKNQPTHERLYNLQKERQAKQAQAVLNVNQQLQAQRVGGEKNLDGTLNTSKRIPDRDGKPLDQTLYDDAERRRRDNAKLKEELDKTRDTPKEKMYHNNNSDKYVRLRFEREFEVAEQEISLLDQQENENENQQHESKNLTYERFVQAITYLGFLPLNKTPEGIDKQLCDDLWILLEGDDRGGVTWDSLRVVLLNLIGIKDEKRERARKDDGKTTDDAEAAENPSFTQLGFFDEDVFYLDKKQGHRKFFTYFKNFYVHRVQ